MRIFCSHQGTHQIRDLPKETVFIGRGRGTDAPDLDLTPDIYVSRKHAMLSEKHGALWIEDLGSKLGTTVNGRPIQNQGECRLEPGDIIQIGETELRLEPLPELSPPEPMPAKAPLNTATDFHIEIALDAGVPVTVPAARSEGDRHRHLTLLLDLSAQLSAPGTFEALLQLVLRRLLDAIPEAERGAVLLRGATEDELAVKACVSADSPAVSGLLARRALEEKRGFIWKRNLAVSSSDSILKHGIASGIYAPMLCHGESLGVMCVDSTRLHADFKSADLHLMVAVAGYTSLAVSHRQLRERLGTATF